MISFFPDRSQWNDYEKENDYIHYESSQHFLRTRIRPVPRPYQEQRQEYYRREEDNEPLHWRGRLHPFLYLGLHRSLIHDLHPLHMLILVWVAWYMPLSQLVITPSSRWIFFLQAGHPARPVWFSGIFSRCWQLVHFISSTLEVFFSPERDSQMQYASSKRDAIVQRISPLKRERGMKTTNKGIINQLGIRIPQGPTFLCSHPHNMIRR